MLSERNLESHGTPKWTGTELHCGSPEAITGFMTALNHTVPWGVLLITVWFAERQGWGAFPQFNHTWFHTGYNNPFPRDSGDVGGNSHFQIS